MIFNNKFLLEIVSNEFSIVQVKKSTTNLYTQERVQVAKSFFDALELLMLQRSLKQFIRSVQFVQTSRFGSEIIFYTENAFFSNIIEKFFKSSKKTKILVETKLKDVNRYVSKKKKLIILLDKKFLPFVFKFVEAEVYLIHKILPLSEKLQSGTYKTFNEIKELKKIIFFLVLIKKILASRIHNAPN